jgi:hypothetical protein
VGKSTSVDAKEFSDISKIAEDKAASLSAYENRPEQYEKYAIAHPYDLSLVTLYNKTINGDLKDIKSTEKKINAEVGVYSGISEKDKTALLKESRLYKNYIMRNFIDQSKALMSMED